MIRRLSESIVRWQFRKNILTCEQSSLYQYAYEVMLNQAINMFLALLIAIALNAQIAVLVFLVSYIPLRSYCGGYHARTNGGCTIVSTILILLVCIIEKMLYWDSVIIIIPICLIISGVFIFMFAPVPDKNKPLDGKETIIYRRRSRLVCLVEAVIGAAFWYFGLRAGVVIAISHVILSLMLVYGVFKNKKACD